MKRFIVVMFITVGLMFAGCATLSEPAEAEEVAVVVEEEKVQPKPLAKFDLGISGDVCYPLSGDRQYEVLDCISLQFADVKDGLIKLNLVTAGLLAGGDNMYGVTAVANIPKIITMAGGNWVADMINPSIGLGVLGTPEKGVESLTPVFHLQIIQYDF